MRTTHFILVFALITSGCDSSVRRLRVAGVQGEFCVPNVGYVAQNVWVSCASTVQAPEGLSFGGCHRLIHESDPAECTLPKDFISADVHSLQEHRYNLWRDLKGTADFSGFGDEPETDLNSYPQSNVLVLSNSGISKEWSIWRRARIHTPPKVFGMQDGDELVATCSSIEDFPRSAGLGAPGEYGCYRYVRGPMYGLDYRFISAEKVPSEGQMGELDAALFEQLDHWHCGDK